VADAPGHGLVSLGFSGGRILGPTGKELVEERALWERWF
jgi:hypothetical protein